MDKVRIVLMLSWSSVSVWFMLGKNLVLKFVEANNKNPLFHPKDSSGPMFICLQNAC